MLTFDDCVGFSDLSPEEIAAIAEHERISLIVALELGTCLMKTEPGRARIKRFIEDDLSSARRLGQGRRARALAVVLERFSARCRAYAPDPNAGGRERGRGRTPARRRT